MLVRNIDSIYHVRESVPPFLPSAQTGAFELLVPLDTSLYNLCSDLIERDLTKATYTIDVSEDKLWFSQGH
jgi:hypothetical protein